MKIKILKFRQDIITPTRAHYNDVGMDVYVTQRAVFQEGATVALPLGFGIEIPDGYSGFIYPKSGLTSKGIICQIPPIDPGYRGEINAIVTNLTNDRLILQPGTKIGQLVILPIIYVDLVDDLGNERGTGAFGSTGA